MQLSEELIGPKSHRSRERKRSKVSAANSGAGTLAHYMEGKNTQTMCIGGCGSRTKTKCVPCDIFICQKCFKKKSLHKP